MKNLNTVMTTCVRSKFLTDAGVTLGSYRLGELYILTSCIIVYENKFSYLYFS